MANTPLSQNFAPGAYLMTYYAPTTAPPTVSGPTASPEDMGLCEGVKMFNRTPMAQALQSDMYGKSDIDAVYQGANMTLSVTFKEWGINQRNAIWPYPGPLGDHGAMGVVGRLLTSLAGIIVLTAVAGTPASTAAGLLKTIRIPYAIIAPDNEIGILLGTEQRDVSVLFKVFPYHEDSDNSNRWFTYT